MLYIDGIYKKISFEGSLHHFCEGVVATGLRVIQLLLRLHPVLETLKLLLLGLLVEQHHLRFLRQLIRGRPTVQDTSTRYKLFVFYRLSQIFALDGSIEYILLLHID